MISVSPEVFTVLSLGARYLFALMGLLIVARAFLWLASDRRGYRERLRNMPGSGLIGELVVISGGGALDEGTFFPVPREGTLGAVRSCDLVIPCPGVHRVHLDFAWRDGEGLVIRPRSGCTAAVNRTPVQYGSSEAAPSLVHGSFLQVGSVLLRLRVYAALDHSAGEFSFDAPSSVPPESSRIPVPEQFPQPFPDPVSGAPAFVPAPVPSQLPGAPSWIPAPESDSGIPPIPAQHQAPGEPLPLPPRAESPGRHSASWKEDWSE